MRCIVEIIPPSMSSILLSKNKDVHQMMKPSNSNRLFGSHAGVLARFTHLLGDGDGAIVLSKSCQEGCEIMCAMYAVVL